MAIIYIPRLPGTLSSMAWGPSRLQLALETEVKKKGRPVREFLREIGVEEEHFIDAMVRGGSYALSRGAASLICRNTDLDETLLTVILCLDAHEGLFLGRAV